MEIEAFKKELIPIKDKLFRLAKTMLQNNEDAEDALQEIYLNPGHSGKVLLFFSEEWRDRNKSVCPIMCSSHVERRIS